jgi:ABC-2 type transport system permease protein
MSLRRVGIILGKDLIHGPKNFIFVWAIIAPVLISLLISLIFGTLFTAKAELGLVDEGNSRLVAKAEELDSIITRQYATDSELKEAVERGSVDIGLVLPAHFDSSVMAGEEVKMTGYIWGESLAKNRYILGITFANLARDLTGLEAPVEIDAITLGDEESIPWNDRLLPFIVLMAVFLGGVFLPATTLIEEKEKKTLEALVVTPTSVMDVFMAKGIFGLVLSLFMGIVILVLNQAFGSQPWLLVLILFLGAIMASEVGLICGALIKDITTLFAVWKTGGILLFGPAIVFMFPQIPQWIGRIFPTFYLLDPIVAISQGGSSWGDIATNVFILIGLDLILIVVLFLTVRRTRQFAS